LTSLVFGFVSGLRSLDLFL